MKKIILLFITAFIFSLNVVSAKQVVEKLPENFKVECFEYYKSIPASSFLNSDTLSIFTDKNNLFAKQGNRPIWTIDYKNMDNRINFSIKPNIDKGLLADNNIKTYEEIDTKDNKKISIEFEDTIKSGSFKFNFNYDSKYYTPTFIINNDSIVNRNDITNFDIKSIEIIFELKNTQKIREKIKIYELSFNKSGFTKLLGSSVWEGENIEFFSDYKCSGNFDFNRYSDSGLEYNLDKNTKIIDVILGSNLKYNPVVKSDIDKDLVFDDLDNCKNIYNPMQKDKNGDGVGDLCADDDRDGIIGIKDNCIDISNSDQKDININGVGDVCEFDFDKDGIFDGLDNCRNIKNTDQADNDNDGIGNSCDNCNLYNPRQLDKNGSGVGDVCEQKVKHLEENDKDGDKIVDDIDNCSLISNPDQFDFDKDGVGDLCDNCKNIQNPDQLDLLKNGVGDICEDSDGDGIDGITDNCINISNSDQKDTNNDGVGDVCEDSDSDSIFASNDNCPYNYNPDQSDIDKDNIGDKCDNEDNRFIESNKTFFILFMIILVILFGSGIFYMGRKLNTKK